MLKNINLKTVMFISLGVIICIYMIWLICQYRDYTQMKSLIEACDIYGITIKTTYDYTTFIKYLVSMF